MKERIQKIIASRGLASRRKAEEMIASGRVMCNGSVAHLGDCADGECDIILVDGRPLPSAEAHVYIMLHKPRGYVTTLSDEHGRKNAAELVSACGKRVYPIGRLDMDSEGLLLFTNDGDFANRIMHPRHEISKQYQVFVQRYSDNAYEKLKQPVVLDGYTIRKPDVSVIKKDFSDNLAILNVTIHEGRNRQVRRMCQAAGMDVLRLIRIKEGSLALGDLPPGKWRYLTDKEIQCLKQMH